MSAPQIPNLLTTRGGPRSRAGRGRGRGNSAGYAEHGGPAFGAQHRKDLDIQSTDTDAAVSRLSAVSLGYLNDPYASYFVAGPSTRRLPIINRGTYTRTTALDILVNAFLDCLDTENIQQTKQIISLGAGTDTRYFRLRAQNKHLNLIYHEFDFPSVCETKRRIISKNNLFACNNNEILFPDKQAAIAGPADRAAEWGFQKAKDGEPETVYCCHPLDLRHLPNRNPSQQFRSMRTDVPTLIISECCLCYLDVDTSRDVVKWFVDKIPSLGIIFYEPIGVDDSFGQMMVANLAARNITMPSLKVYKTLEDQKARLVELGFVGSFVESGREAETMEKIWNKWVPATEKQRVDVLEGLDEIEEWQMLASHYAVAWGWKGIQGWNGWIGLRDHS